MHQQLCLVNSQLAPFLPVFPQEPFGRGTLLFGGVCPLPQKTTQEINALCYQPQAYLGQVPLEDPFPCALHLDSQGDTGRESV